MEWGDQPAMYLSTVRVATDHRIATVTLDSASSGNEVTERVALELRDVCDHLDQDDDVAVVILTGEGEVFCRGTGPHRPQESVGPPEALRLLKVAGRIAAIKKPVIAAINGDAIGQGLELALGCDIRIASGRARLGMTQVKDGLMPWDGGTQRLPRLIGRGRAIEMVLTSRVVDAEEARDMGLVSQVVEPDQVLTRAQELASTIASHGPIAARYLKEAVVKGMDMSLEQGLRLEADLNLILQSTADRAEGISSFLERRKPIYRGE